MKPITTALFFLLSFCAVAQLTNKQVHDLKGGRVQPDNSFVYSLPYAKGYKFLLIQAYNSNRFSHQKELSLDFKMKQGSPICAARSGVVAEVKEDSNEGGAKDEFLSKGNHIIIRHSDGSKAKYWHLQQDGVLVNVGDTVTQGQHIGLSGNTGYSGFPHLHFQVTDKNGNELPTRFFTRKGIRYLRPGKWYKSI